MILEVLTPCGANALQGSAGGEIGIIDVGIEFDRDPSLVIDGPDGGKRGREVDHAFARHQMMMDTRGGDVLEMKMADVLGDARNRRRRLVLHAVSMADVEV